MMSSGNFASEITMVYKELESSNKRNIEKISFHLDKHNRTINGDDNDKENGQIEIDNNNDAYDKKRCVKN